MTHKRYKLFFEDQIDKSDELLYKGEWHEIRRTEGGYEYLVNNPGVAVFPYRMINDNPEYLVRYEENPVYGLTKSITIVTGGIENGESAFQGAVRELKEETGYTIDPLSLISLGKLRIGKDSLTSISLFTVDLSGIEKGIITTDGSEHEQNADNEWVDKLKLRELFKKTDCVYLLSAFTKLVAYN